MALRIGRVCPDPDRNPWSARWARMALELPAASVGAHSAREPSPAPRWTRHPRPCPPPTWPSRPGSSGPPRRACATCRSRPGGKRARATFERREARPSHELAGWNTPEDRQVVRNDLLRCDGIATHIDFGSTTLALSFVRFGSAYVRESRRVPQAVCRDGRRRHTEILPSSATESTSPQTLSTTQKRDAHQQRRMVT